MEPTTKLSKIWRMRLDARRLKYAKSVGGTDCVPSRLVADVLMRRWKRGTGAHKIDAKALIADLHGPKIRWIDFRGTGIYT